MWERKKKASNNNINQMIAFTIENAARNAHHILCTILKLKPEILRIRYMYEYGWPITVRLLSIEFNAIDRANERTSEHLDGLVWVVVPLCCSWWLMLLFCVFIINLFKLGIGAGECVTVRFAYVNDADHGMIDKTEMPNFDTLPINWLSTILLGFFLLFENVFQFVWMRINSIQWPVSAFFFFDIFNLLVTLYLFSYCFVHSIYRWFCKNSPRK